MLCKQSIEVLVPPKVKKQLVNSINKDEYVATSLVEMMLKNEHDKRTLASDLIRVFGHDFNTIESKGSHTSNEKEYRERTSLIKKREGIKNAEAITDISDATY